METGSGIKTKNPNILRMHKKYKQSIFLTETVIIDWKNKP